MGARSKQRTRQPLCTTPQLQHLDKSTKTTRSRATPGQCLKERTLGPSGCFWNGNHRLPLPHVKKTEDFHTRLLLQNFPLLCRFSFFFLL